MQIDQKGQLNLFPVLDFDCVIDISITYLYISCSTLSKNEVLFPTCVMISDDGWWKWFSPGNSMAVSWNFPRTFLSPPHWSAIQLSYVGWNNCHGSIFIFKHRNTFVNPVSIIFEQRTGFIKFEGRLGHFLVSFVIIKRVSIVHAVV